MATASLRPSDPEVAGLEVRLEQPDIYVSYLSNLLRALQVALREVAREDPETRQYFVQKPNPVLSVTRITATGDIDIHLTFVDPKTRLPLPVVSDRVFTSFLARFIQVLRTQPQLSLWGLPIPKRTSPARAASRHIEQLMQVLRHFSGALLRYGEHQVSLHGDRVDVKEPVSTPERTP